MSAFRRCLACALLLSAAGAAGARPQPLPPPPFALVERGGFSPDGKLLWLAGKQSLQVAYVLESGKELRKLTQVGPLDPPPTALLPPGDRPLAVRATDEPVAGKYLSCQTLEVFDVEDDTRVRVLYRPLDDGRFIRSLAVSADGRRALAGCDDGKLRLWDPSTGEYVRTLDSRAQGAVTALSLSADGRLALAGGRCNVGGAALTLWDVASGKAVHHFPNPGSGAGLDSWDDVLALAPSGKWMAAGKQEPADAPGQEGEYRLVLLNAVNGQELRRYPCRPSCVAFSADGKQLLAAGWDEKRAWLRSWEVRTGQPVRSVSLLGAEVGSVRLVGQTPEQTKVDVTFAAFSPDGNLLVLAGGGIGWRKDGSEDTLWVKVWDTQTGAVVRVLRAPLVKGPARSRWQFWRAR
jgi:WD40 repeat protein